MKKFIIWLAGVFNVELQQKDNRRVTFETFADQEIKGDLIIHGNLVVDGEILASGEITAFNNL